MRKAGSVAGWAAVWGGVVDLRLVRDGVFTLGPRMLGVWAGGSLSPGSGVGGRVVSVRRKASKAAFPPLMVRICIGPCGDGTNCTLHLVFDRRRSEFLGLPLERFVTVAACTRGAGTLASRLVIEVMRKPCACCICDSWCSLLGPIGQGILPQMWIFHCA